MIFFYLLLLLIGVLISFYKWRINYWKRKGVVYDDPILILGKDSSADITLRRYQKFKSLNVPHGGAFLFLTPMYIPMDLTIIKKMMTTDFPHFLAHGNFHHPNDVLSMHLFNLEGEIWRSLRMKLTPTFTSGKMKMMFETLVEKANIFDKLVMKLVDSKETIDIKDILARFTTDIIGSCAFGIECNSMEDPKNEFRIYGSKIFKLNFFKFALLAAFPRKLLNAFKFQQNDSDVTKFFSDVVKDTIRTREMNKIIRKDFMHLLIEMKKPNSTVENENNQMSHNQLTVNEIIAQCFVFFIAGFETSSTTMTFCMLELAQNVSIQEKLREEIKEMLEKNDGEISYNNLMHNMPYLDKVINETLRMYPPLPLLFRQCSKTYKVPNTDVIIEKGTSVQIPILGIHRDPEYYPNPEIFDPERFSPENIAKRPDFSFLPFGEGPRMCIGMRFGLMQTKLGLVTLLKNYQFSLSKKTILPIEFDRANFIMTVKGDVWLEASRI